MAKSDITHEQARGLVDRVAQELGLLVNDNSGFLKVQGPTNKHRLYIQKSKMLNRIDFTVDLEQDDPARIPLEDPIGSVRCHVSPTLEHLERCLRMLGDSGLGTQVPNKPRPFAANKAPARRQPKVTATPVPMDELVEPKEYIAEGGTLEERVKYIRARARAARIAGLIEQGKAADESEAAAILDGKIEVEDVSSGISAAQAAETQELLAETGVIVGD